jgi:hypothetical protein
MPSTGPFEFYFFKLLKTFFARVGHDPLNYFDLNMTSIRTAESFLSSEIVHAVKGRLVQFSLPFRCIVMSFFSRISLAS